MIIYNYIILYYTYTRTHINIHIHAYTLIYLYINVTILYIYIYMIFYTNRESTCVPMYLHYTPGTPDITHKHTSETDTTHLIINYVYNFGDAGHLAFLQGPTPQSDNPERLIFS